MGKDLLDGLLLDKLFTDKSSKMSITVTQAPGSDFTGTSLAVLMDVKELLTDTFLFSTVFRCQI